MKLMKTSDQVNVSTSVPNLEDNLDNKKGISRRSFLKNSGLMAGGATILTAGVSSTMMEKAEAKPNAGSNTEVKKTVCTHCSVGCGILAEVTNGVWTGQEPAFDHPFNRASPNLFRGRSNRDFIFLVIFKGCKMFKLRINFI